MRDIESGGSFLVDALRGTKAVLVTSHQEHLQQMKKSIKAQQA